MKTGPLVTTVSWHIRRINIQFRYLWLSLVLAIPSSAVPGSLRIRGFLPDSSLASWIIMISAPFYSLLILVSLVFIVQMAGSFILVVGTLLLCSRPWLFVYRRELYFSVSTEEKEKKIDKNHRIMLAITVVSFTIPKSSRPSETRPLFPTTLARQYDTSPIFRKSGSLQLPRPPLSIWTFINEPPNPSNEQH